MWATDPGAHSYTRSRPAQAPGTALKAASALGERECGEVERLRKELVALTKKRDLLRRAAVLMLKQAQSQK